MEAQGVKSQLAILQKRHPLVYYISARILSMVSMLFLLGMAVFGLMQLAPGDIVDNYAKQVAFQAGNDTIVESGTTGAGQEQVPEEELIRLTKKRLGLDKPFYIQYFSWLRRVFIDRDLGMSLVSRAPVLFLIRKRLINSLVLNIISLITLTVISFVVSIALTAMGRSKADVILGIVAVILNAIPAVLFLTMLQLFAAITGWFPITAYPDFEFAREPMRFLLQYPYHIFLPLLGAFLGGIGSTMRSIRAYMLDQMGKPYIMLLRSRRISETRILFSHAFRNSLNPYITSSATLLASLFSGSLILEIIFSYPGLGTLLYEATLQEDINIVVTNIMFISTLLLVGTILADILLAFVDPRIRFRSADA